MRSPGIGGRIGRSRPAWTLRASPALLAGGTPPFRSGLSPDRLSPVGPARSGQLRRMDAMSNPRHGSPAPTGESAHADCGRIELGFRRGSYMLTIDIREA